MMVCFIFKIFKAGRVAWENMREIPGKTHKRYAQKTQAVETWK